MAEWPDENDNVPEVDLRITSETVRALPRKLNVTWGERRYIDVVERLAAIAQGKPDPGEWESLVSAEDDLRSLRGNDLESQRNT